MLLRDLHGRPLRNLRLSVTDRCNLRCAYCMPEEQYTWLPRRDILSFEEISQVADVFLALGVDKLRLTGGEPLLRKDLDVLIALLAEKDGVRDLALTTNGLLLEEQAERLFAAGLGRITVSLDTLDPARFRALTRRDELARTLAGLEAVAGRPGLKIDTVVLRGTNDDELVPLLDHGARVGAEVRFIEYMDVGGATSWNPAAVVTRAELLARLERELGPIQALPAEDSAPADRFRLSDGRTFGIISSTSAPFCGSCDRSRLTADGMWYLCLYARIGFDLRALLRSGATAAELAEHLTRTWSARADRGAEERLSEHARGALLSPDALRADPHLEMHTRGG